MMRLEDRLSIADGYGSVYVTSISSSFAHVSGKRLQPLCRMLGIKFANALIGWTGRVYRKPVFDGVVVGAEHAELLTAAIAERAKRSEKRNLNHSPAERRLIREQKAIAAFSKQIKERFPSCPDDEIEKIASWTCETGSGRVGRSRTADDPVLAAVISHIRHNHTEYDNLLADGYDREYARFEVREAITAKLDEWEMNKES